MHLSRAGVLYPDPEETALQHGTPSYMQAPTAPYPIASLHSLLVAVIQGLNNRTRSHSRPRAEISPFRSMVGIGSHQHRAPQGCTASSGVGITIRDGYIILCIDMGPRLSLRCRRNERDAVTGIGESGSPCVVREPALA